MEIQAIERCELQWLMKEKRYNRCRQWWCVGNCWQSWQLWQFWRLWQLLASQKIFEGSKFVTTLSWNTVEANWKKIRQWLPKSQKTSFTVWLILGTADNASTCYFTQKNTLKSGWEMTCSISIGRHIGDIRFLIWGLGYRNVALMLAILDPNPWWSDGSNFRECRIRWLWNDNSSANPDQSHMVSVGSKISTWETRPTGNIRTEVKIFRIGMRQYSSAYMYPWFK